MILLVVVHDRPLRALPVESQQRVLVPDGPVRHRQGRRALALAHDVLAVGTEDGAPRLSVPGRLFLALDPPAVQTVIPFEFRMSRGIDERNKCPN
eukprot:CAMPEP_0194343260 /NCGR_PEP_ID=MMETSP0171-20130528/96000_1 /TAXON_ID=218684 /ORGANISM="Corethron pennatum, Strain L29A3" /LENGTH=94 /DNA_ID=CAMNT_0039109359 /DNA_START=500 /DNA_END=784 /DNA_ORIENTATION=-